ENNAGKSNILRAIACFLEVGAGGMKSSDFNDPGQPAVIEAEFGGLSLDERNRLRRYLIGDRLIIQKHLQVTGDTKTGKTRIAAQYHGYQAQPKAWFLSMEKIEAKDPKPNLKKIAEEHGLLSHVATEDGRVTKTSYARGLEAYLTEHPDVEYDTPELGTTKALGI